MERFKSAKFSAAILAQIGKYYIKLTQIDSLPCMQAGTDNDIDFQRNFVILTIALNESIWIDRVEI